MGTWPSSSTRLLDKAGVLRAARGSQSKNKAWHVAQTAPATARL